MSKRKVEPSPEELSAFKIVSDVLGVRVVPYDDGSAREGKMVDALIQLVDGSEAALEIIGDHDSEFMALWKRLNKSGHKISVPALKYGWHVGIRHSVNVNRLTTALPAFLIDLEERGITSTVHLTSRLTPLTVDLYEQMEALRIDSARQDPNMPKGVVQFWVQPWSGTVGLDDDVLADWISTVLAEQTDVAPKLRNHSGVTERHAFIWSTVRSSYAIQSYLEDDGPVEESMSAPERPEGITHIWIAGTMSSQGVVAWFPDRGWWRPPSRWPETARDREIAAKIAGSWPADGS